MPEDNSDTCISDSPIRINQDKHANSFGRKLLSFCNVNSVLIANGRIEQGNTNNNTIENKTIFYYLDQYMLKPKEMQS